MKKYVEVINKNDYKLDYDAAVGYMDDETREELHSKLSPCTEQDFFTAYEKAHFKKYNEDWFLSDSNPKW